MQAPRELPTRAQIQADPENVSYIATNCAGMAYLTGTCRWPQIACSEALTNTVGNDERGRWIFAPEHREAAHSELALTGLASGRLTQVIIDRSFVDRDGTRWVIDFKTSRHEGGGLDAFLTQELERYRSQLETYVALARGLGPKSRGSRPVLPLLAACSASWLSLNRRRAQCDRLRSVLERHRGTKLPELSASLRIRRSQLLQLVEKRRRGISARGDVTLQRQTPAYLCVSRTVPCTARGPPECPVTVPCGVAASAREGERSNCPAAASSRQP